MDPRRGAPEHGLGILPAFVPLHPAMGRSLAHVLCMVHVVPPPARRLRPAHSHAIYHRIGPWQVLIPYLMRYTYVEKPAQLLVHRTSGLLAPI